MSTEFSSPGNDSKNTDPGSSSTEYAFVNEGNKSQARKHAMRHTWRQRRTRNSRTSIPKSRPKILHSRSPTRENLARSKDVQYHEHAKNSSCMSSADQCQEYMGNEIDTDLHGRYEVCGIPAQILSGMNNVLSSVMLYPAKELTIELTSQHWKLLHHWLTIYAGMVFEESVVSRFNPMKDVWLPLDLSNVASFNAIMAHSAAHLASLYSKKVSSNPTTSPDALKYKLEAVKILRDWLSSPQEALGNACFAATIRLLSFDSCWGTAGEWNTHQAGLQVMLDARGGITGLKDDWRLQLAVYMTSLIEKPSWFEEGNRLPDISSISCLGTNIAEPGFSPHNVRSLWLVSFIEHIRTFYELFLQCYPTGVSFIYPSLYEAILLCNEYWCDSSDASPKADTSLPEFDGLVCLISICLMVQGSLKDYVSNSENPTPRKDKLGELEASLTDSHPLWDGSVYSLRSLLHLHMLSRQGGGQMTNYSKQLVEAVCHLNVEMRLKIRRCLLNILSYPNDEPQHQRDDENCTPHSLLSSIR